MAITSFLVSLLKIFFKDIFYVFIRQFLAGFRDSLYGFVYVQKLESSQTSKPVPKVIKNEPTVLYHRRLKEGKGGFQAKQQSDEDFVRKKASGPKLVLQCIIVNLAFTMVLYFVVIPVFQLLYGLVDTEWPADWCLLYIRKSILVIANIVCCSFYIPLYLFMKVFNVIWCLDVSNAALRYKNIHAIKYRSFAYGVGDMLVGLLVELLFMIQTWLVTWVDFRISVVGQLVCFVHLSLLYSLFSYEYVWTAKGIRVATRLDFIERNWPYYLGFGALMAVAGMIWTEFIRSYLVFGMCFPFFIISAYVTDEEKKRIQNPLPPLHLFLPCLLIANRISNMVANAVNHFFAKEVQHAIPERKESRLIGCRSSFPSSATSSSSMVSS